MAKRIYRNDMTQAQKDKIAAANIGKRLSQATKDKISKAMTEYWQSLPYKPASTSGRPTATSCTTDQIRRAATGSTITPPPLPLSPHRTPPKTQP